jgi:hypothetical protein
MRSVIEDASGAGTPYTLASGDAQFPVVGTFGDIGSLIDPVTGEAIQGRTIEATCVAQTILAAAGKIPARGWRAYATGLDGKGIALFVQRNEYDRTIGLCRLTLGLQLQEAENGE